MFYHKALDKHIKIEPTKYKEKIEKIKKQYLADLEEKMNTEKDQ